MARTTSSAVQAVLIGQYDSVENYDLTPFIEVASAVVDDVYECAFDKGVTLSATRLELIERWLAAHFYKLSDKGFASSSQQGASASYDGQTGMGFDATLYGQTASRLDSSGCLENLDKTQEASLDWLGKPPSTQIPYDQRD